MQPGLASTLAIALALSAAACSHPSADNTDSGAGDSGATIASAHSEVDARDGSAPPLVTRALVHEGGALAKSPRDDVLFIADEDHHVVRVVPIPGVAAAAIAIAVPMPGAPAQVLALADRVLVTVRDPGLLLVLRHDDTHGLVETARVALPADAWGVSVTPDEKTAIVSSAWTHRVSAIDLDLMTKRWTVEVAREPRGIVVRADGAAAYVTHLVGAALTRIDGIGLASPSIRRVDLPASPLRTPSSKSLDASLGYAAVLSDDGARLYVGRHALGAMGTQAWFGASTVDVLLTATDAPLAPHHSGRLPFTRVDKDARGTDTNLPGVPLAPFTQPRAIVYRKSTRSVLVAGEGDDVVAELDAFAVDPTLAVLRTYKVGSGYDTNLPVAATCGAPTGLALSTDETTLWVFCRSTYDLATVHLDPHTPGSRPDLAPVTVVHVADDPLDANIAVGRRIFYNATDSITSGGLACAGCHPEGRDDGHVWHEAKFSTDDGAHVNFVGVLEDVPEEDRVKGVPRRTPMLAGRVDATGPYGWHAESPDLPDRVKRGFGLHRWGGIPAHEEANLDARATHLIGYLRKGLVPPPREQRDLTDEEKHGQTIFRSEEARCFKCHAPESEYTDRMAYALPRLPARSDFDDEPSAEFKTPSLFFVTGRAPYFHDGSAASLEDLLERNADRMGHTSQLSKEDRAALAAFLRTL